MASQYESEKVENLLAQTGSMGCKWSSLNAPGTENPLWLEEFPFPIIGLWGNKKWLPTMKVKNIEKFQNIMG